MISPEEIRTCPDCGALCHSLASFEKHKGGAACHANQLRQRYRKSVHAHEVYREAERRRRMRARRLAYMQTYRLHYAAMGKKSPGA